MGRYIYFIFFVSPVDDTKASASLQFFQSSRNIIAKCPGFLRERHQREGTEEEGRCRESAGDGCSPFGWARGACRDMASTVRLAGLAS